MTCGLRGAVPQPQLSALVEVEAVLVGQAAAQPPLHQQGAVGLGLGGGEARGLDTRLSTHHTSASHHNHVCLLSGITISFSFRIHLHKTETT